MIQFKEINGQLCLMLEKAVPLTEDAKFPCVVRMIQDESPMGRYNTHGLIVSCFEPIIATGSYNGRTASKEEPFSGWDINRYEILGYPVADHSAEWALWRMMQGDKVTKRPLKHTYWHYDARPHLKCISEYNCEILQIMVSPDIWIKTADREGWQIYAEPKPNPLAVQVGDYVRTSKGDGKVIEIPLTMPEVMLSNGQRGSFHADEISGISPAEVVIPVQLSGTVRKGLANSTIFHLVYGKGECDYSIIDFNHLVPTTRELVESLLKAQEES